VTDLAGNTSGPSEVVDPPIASAAPAIASVSSSTGNVGGSTDTNSLALKSTAEANTTASIYDGSALLGTATTSASGSSSLATARDVINVYDSTTNRDSTTVDSNGTWSFKTAAMSNTVHMFSSTVTDLAGNSGQSSGAVVYDTSGNNTLVRTTGNDLMTSAGGVNMFNGTNFGNSMTTDFWPRGSDIFQFDNQKAAGVANAAALAQIADGTHVQSEGSGHGADLSQPIVAHHWDLV
jgi:hypothetical protein